VYNDLGGEAIFAEPLYCCYLAIGNRC